MSKIKKIGIIGAGQMGSGIAHVFALADYDIALNDLDSDAINAAIGQIEKNMGRQLAKDKITKDDLDAGVKKLHATPSFNDLADCDLVIEAATENAEIKKNIFGALSKILQKDGIIATNTSSISITALGASTDRPEKFIGVHFMNPVPIMRLVEVIRGIATSQQTFETATNLIDELGKTTAVAEDFPAFIVNRILMPMINEAIYTLYEGVGTVSAIDTGMKLGANHPMGPLELADFIGLDTCLSIMQVLYDGLSDSKYRPCPLLIKYVEAGWLGKKTGRGFYDYSSDTPVPTR
ncbi:MAG: 3-hydroxybutyryl-CoA dehydrogenase [Parvularculaceae bacterium]